VQRWAGHVYTPSAGTSGLKERARRAKLIIIATRTADDDNYRVTVRIDNSARPNCSADYRYVYLITVLHDADASSGSQAFCAVW
jgi:hypothetical protein